MPIYKSNKPAKDGRKYYFKYNYKDKEGNYKQYASKLFLTKKEAEKEEAKFKLSLGTTVPSSQLTFGQVIPSYLESIKADVKPQTYKHIVALCNTISKYLGDIRIEKLSREQFEKFRLSLPFSTKYNNRLIDRLKNILSFSRSRYGVFNEIPFEYKRLVDSSPIKKEMDFYTLEEWYQYREAIDDDRYLALFSTLFYLGLRIGEANALTFNDIDFEKGIVNISKTLTTKIKDRNDNYLVTKPKTSASVRSLPVPNHLLDLFKDIRKYYQGFYGYNDDWFIFGGNKAIPESTIQKFNHKYAEASGLRHIRIHDFRHSCASLLISHLGCNITLVSKYLGHSNINITLQTYTHLYKSQLNELTESLNKL